MTWRCWLGDTMTGLIAQPIDVPSFSWSVTVSDCTFKTTQDKGVGVDEVGGVTLPWGAVPADDVAERASMLMPLKRSLTLAWEDEGGTLTPIVWGAIGPRTDTWEDTSFDVTGALGILESRYLVREGVFGAVEGQTEPTGDEPAKPGTFTRDTLFYQNMSLRGIAAEVGRLCTSAKPGGELPIDWQYLGESGGHQRTYEGYDLGNNSGADVLDKIANVDGGPDMQFRPYMADQTHVRLLFCAGSDADVYLGQSTVHTLSWYAGGGGTLQDLEVDFGTPVSRVYATGSGTDEGKLCCLSEDRTLITMGDPWPLIEEHYNDSDVDNGPLLEQHADAELAFYRLPKFQVRGNIDFADEGVPKPGSIWPGEMVELWIEGFPTLPDGLYRLRLMSMSGDETTTAQLEFRPEEVILY